VILLPNIYSFDGIYRIFYSICSVKLGGMLLHAASLVRNEKAYVFTGITESGKSEIAEMAKDSVYLTDELTVIRPLNGRFHAFGTPFWGLFAKGGANIGVPIEKLFFLVRDSETYTVEISPASVMPRFMRNVLNFAENKEHNAMIFDNLTRFVREVWLAELHCVPDPAIWPIVDAPLPTR